MNSAHGGHIQSLFLFNDVNYQSTSPTYFENIESIEEKNDIGSDFTSSEVTDSQTFQSKLVKRLNKAIKVVFEVSASC